MANSIAFAGQPFERSCLVLGCLTKFFFSFLFLLPFSIPTNSILCQNRGRLAEKRTIPLPPTRIPKKELTSIFSHSDDSEESDKSNGQHPEVKQEEDLHISIMKRRYFPASALQKQRQRKLGSGWPAFVGQYCPGCPKESPPGPEIKVQMSHYSSERVVGPSFLLTHSCLGWVGLYGALQRGLWVCTEDICICRL